MKIFVASLATILALTGGALAAGNHAGGHGHGEAGMMAIGKPGAINAGLLAAAILATGDAALAQRLDDWRARQTQSVADTVED